MRTRYPSVRRTLSLPPPSTPPPSSVPSSGRFPERLSGTRFQVIFAWVALRRVTIVFIGLPSDFSISLDPLSSAGINAENRTLAPLPPMLMSEMKLARISVQRLCGIGEKMREREQEERRKRSKRDREFKKKQREKNTASNTATNRCRIPASSHPPHSLSPFWKVA